MSLSNAIQVTIRCCGKQALELVSKSGWLVLWVDAWMKLGPFLQSQAMQHSTIQCAVQSSTMDGSAAICHKPEFSQVLNILGPTGTNKPCAHDYIIMFSRLILIKLY